jgi:hypothetical protein
MNVTRHFVAILVSTTFGVAAHAQEATPDTWTKVHASQTRDSVRQQIASADPSVKAEAYDFMARPASTRTRGEVLSDLVAAKASGKLASLNGEAYNF